jgi:hypothetical protein
MSKLHKKERQTSHFFHYSKELQANVLEIHDINGMFPLYIFVPGIPSVGTRKINLIKRKDGSRGLQMT